jgi:hypothetical protein
VLAKVLVRVAATLKKGDSLTVAQYAAAHRLEKLHSFLFANYSGIGRISDGQVPNEPLNLCNTLLACPPLTET